MVYDIMLYHGDWYYDSMVQPRLMLVLLLLLLLVVVVVCVMIIVCFSISSSSSSSVVSIISMISSILLHMSTADGDEVSGARMASLQLAAVGDD